MLYYLYKTTNTINGKIYVGVHSTRNMDDGYLGSGVNLVLAIKKYGSENFKKEILEMFDDEESMFNKEFEVVTEEFINRDDVYNLTIGGRGGSSYAFHKWWNSLSEEEKKEINKKKAQPGESNPMYGTSRCGADNPHFGGKHTDVTKKIISDTNKNKMMVMDAVTKEIIGQVPMDHECILSGVWVSINKGRIASDETRLKLSKAKKATRHRPPSPAGKLWWNNGVVNFRGPETPGEGWVRGRLKFKHKKNQHSV